MIAETLWIAGGIIAACLAGLAVSWFAIVKFVPARYQPEALGAACGVAGACVLLVLKFLLGPVPSQ